MVEYGEITWHDNFELKQAGLLQRMVKAILINLQQKFVDLRIEVPILSLRKCYKYTKNWEILEKRSVLDC